MSFDPNYPPYYPPPAEALLLRARERVQFPAIFLIAVGLFNLLAAAALALGGFAFASLPEDRFEQMLLENQAQQWAQLEQAGWTPQRLLRVYAVSGYTSGAVVGVLALLVLLGAIRMLLMRSYGLAVFASIVAAIPCLSPSGCCLLGEIVGIWSLVVLMDPDVREAFR
jgi:hypothetical protein